MLWFRGEIPLLWIKSWACVPLSQKNVSHLKRYPGLDLFQHLWLRLRTQAREQPWSLLGRVLWGYLGLEMWDTRKLYKLGFVWSCWTSGALIPQLRSWIPGKASWWWIPVIRKCPIPCLTGSVLSAIPATSCCLQCGHGKAPGRSLCTGKAGLCSGWELL